MIKKLISTLRYLIIEKKSEALTISTETYDYLKYFIPIILFLFNRNYVYVKFFRYINGKNNLVMTTHKGKKKNRRTKKQSVVVVVGLINHGRNVRRRTSGIGKKHIMESAVQPICVYCDTPLTFSTISVDHIIPISKGGTNTKWNLINNCCVECNMERSNMDFYTYLFKKKPDYRLMKYPAV